MSLSMQQPARRSGPCDLGGRCQRSDQGLLWSWSCPEWSASLEFSAGAPLPALSPSWQFNTVYCADYLESHWCNKHPCRQRLGGARWDQAERARRRDEQVCPSLLAHVLLPRSQNLLVVRQKWGVGYPHAWRHYLVHFTCGPSPFRKFQVLVWVNRINRMQMKRLLKC